MIKYSVIKNGIVTNTWFSDFADETYYESSFGKPERWVEEGSEPYSHEDVLEEKLEEISPEIPAVMGIDEAKEKVMLTPAVPAVTRKMVKLKAEYELQIEDITEQLQQEKINQESLQYLESTDWLIIREMDSGIPCPEEIKQKRAKARAKIVR